MFSYLFIGFCNKIRTDYLLKYSHHLKQNEMVKYFQLKKKRNPQVLLSLLYYPVTLNSESFKGLDFFLILLRRGGV